ncbi:MAG: translation initiation factor IF-2 [Deltaproteobacteria bacterium]|nr:translation initiation factor IF-2 [Deltaproteobacteria bacterium]
MAKKDLLERLSQAPTDGLTRRVEPSDGPRPTSDLIQTRVSRKVVRRRRKEPSPVVVEEAEATVAPTPPTTVPTELCAGEKVEETAAPAEEAAPKVEEPTAEVPVEEVSVAVPEPVEAPQAEEIPAVEPVQEAPAPAPEPVVAAESESEPAPAPAPTPIPKPESGQVPEQPRFEGLGKAVVMPPPGYDPTNPENWRREQTARPARPRPPAAKPKAPATPAEDAKFRGRRRVAAGAGDYRDGRRGARRGRNAPGRNLRHRDGPMRRKPRRKGGGGVRTPSPTPKAIKRKVRVDNVISVSQLAHEMGIKASQVIKELMGMDYMATANEMLDIDTASLVAAEFEYQVENVGFQEKEFIPQMAEGEDEGAKEPRPPVVTIMGHVDHGKTTLLDGIRDARVALGEAGGITQHIGAYQVEQEDRVVTFIDTPGHAAFTEMRARGASVTDIVVLVVAADDGVQPQTEEAISHAKAADVPIVVAINKIDRPGVNPDQIKNKLGEYGLSPEEWGGDTLFAEVSALKRQGIDELLEQILLQADLLDLTANPDRHAEGVVIESKMERGRGAVATVLVHKGTLPRGDHVVLGAVYGKVRAMVDHKGEMIQEAGPSMPVEIFGLNHLPQTGDVLTTVESEKNAKTLAEHRAAQQRQEELARHRRRTAEDLFAAARGEELRTLNIILKADVQGSLEAIRAAIERIDVDGAEVRILHAGVGAISESDVNLAASDNALLIGFGVSLDPNARAAASGQGVEAELFDVIYGVLDRVKGLLTGLLEPEYESVRRGSAEVRAIFRISKVGTVAGCFVLDGVVGRNHTAKLLRKGRELWEGRVSTLKRFKDDVKEVQSGYECGIALEGYNRLEEGDVIETYSLEEVGRE